MFDATQQDVSLGLGHMFDATQQDVSFVLGHVFVANVHLPLHHAFGAT